MKKIVVLMGAMFAMTGCDKKPAEGAKEGDKAAEGAKAEGGGSCAVFTKATEACIAKLAPEAQGAAKDAVAKVVEGFKGDEALCKAGLDAQKASLGAQCPDVKWE